MCFYLCSEGRYALWISLKYFLVLNCFLSTLSIYGLFLSACFMQILDFPFLLPNILLFSNCRRSSRYADVSGSDSFYYMEILYTVRWAKWDQYLIWFVYSLCYYVWNYNVLVIVDQCSIWCVFIVLLCLNYNVLVIPIFSLLNLYM